MWYNDLTNLANNQLECTMKNNFAYKTLAFVFITVLCLQPFALFAAAQSNPEADEPIVVIAGSDLQRPTTEEGISTVSSILASIKNDGYNSIYGFLFCGDYSKGYTVMDAEIKALKDEVKSKFPSVNESDMVFVKGNHDNAGTKSLSKSGANDSKHYGVFVIHESDYMWYNKYEGVIKSTAEKLDAYLKEKSENGYDKPIFIASHLSLAYSKRTYNDGDGKYAKYIFDVLNKYGDVLNIIFMYGHNHNNKYDNYMGGSNVYLTKGDEICIGKLGEQTATPDKYTLNFTYLNAGYVGDTYCLNEQQTMTLFEISGNRVVIKRYSQNGQVALKTKGAWSTSLGDSAEFYGITNDYLNTTYFSDYIGKGKYDNGITVMSDSISNLKVTADKTNPNVDFYRAYVSYTAECEGCTDGEKLTVKVSLPDGFKTNTPVFADVNGGNDLIMVLNESGTVVFDTDSIGGFSVFQIKGYTAGNGLVVYCPVPDGQLINGDSAEGRSVGKLYLAENKETETIDITPDMLRDADGNAIALKPGTYTDLSVYQGDRKLFSGYTLTVTEDANTGSEFLTALVIVCIAGFAAVAAVIAVTIVKKKKQQE